MAGFTRRYVEHDGHSSTGHGGDPGQLPGDRHVYSSALAPCHGPGSEPLCSSRSRYSCCFSLNLPCKTARSFSERCTSVSSASRRVTASSSGDSAIWSYSCQGSSEVSCIGEEPFCEVGVEL